MTRTLRKILLLVLLAVAVYWLLQRSGKLPSLSGLFAPKPIEVENTMLLVKNIKAIAQLMTIEYYDEVVVDSSRRASTIPVPPFIVPFRSSLVLIVKGRLLAGLDLQQLDGSHISGTRDSIAIRLPKAQVLDVIMNPSDVETFSERGQWTQEAVTALEAKARRQILSNAKAQGVLRRADEKAQSLVEQLLLNAGYKKVVVTIM